MRNNKGFSIIELLVIMVILAIMASLAVPSYLKNLEERNLEADSIALFSLNDATKSLAIIQDVNPSDVFDTCPSTQDKIDYLVENGFVISVPNPETNASYFAWDSTNSSWVLVCVDGTGEHGDTFVLRNDNGDTTVTNEDGSTYLLNPDDGNTSGDTGTTTGDTGTTTGDTGTTTGDTGTTTGDTGTTTGDTGTTTGDTGTTTGDTGTTTGDTGTTTGDTDNTTTTTDADGNTTTTTTDADGNTTTTTTDADGNTTTTTTTDTAGNTTTTTTDTAGNTTTTTTDAYGNTTTTTTDANGNTTTTTDGSYTSGFESDFGDGIGSDEDDEELEEINYGDAGGLFFVDPNLIPEYDNRATYYKGYLVKYDGKVYVCNPSNESKGVRGVAPTKKNGTVQKNYWALID